MNKQIKCPLVSIVTPSFNQGQFLEKTILSVIEQDYPNIEYIIIDGGSTDGSVEVIRKYENRIKYWVSEPDKGQADAVNIGWQMASGEILGWINSDDIYAPGAVSLAVSTLLKNPAIGFVYGDAQIIDIDGHKMGIRKSHPFDYKKLATFDLVPSQPTVFLRHSLFESVEPLDISLQMSMDTDYWFRIGRVTKGHNIPHTIACMRMHSEAKTSKRYNEFLADSLTILHKIFGDPTLPKDIRVLRAKAFSHAYYGAAGRAYQAGVRRQILPLSLRALCTYPNPFDIKTYLSVFMCIEAFTGTSFLKKVAEYQPRRRLVEMIANFCSRSFC